RGHPDLLLLLPPVDPRAAPPLTVAHLRRLPAAVFAGDRRVWRVAAIASLPFVLLTAFYCLRPRFYYTGTDSVEDQGAVAQLQAAAPVCVPGLLVPEGTATLRVQVFANGSQRPPLHLLLR